MVAQGYKVREVNLLVEVSITECSVDDGLHFNVKVGAVQSSAVYVVDGVRGTGVDRYTQRYYCMRRCFSSEQA